MRRNVTSGLGTAPSQPTTLSAARVPAAGAWWRRTRATSGPQVTRKLTIRTKLAATLAVPLVALAAFAALQVRSSYDTADQVKRQAAVATSATGPAGVVNALLVERDFETPPAPRSRGRTVPERTG